MNIRDIMDQQQKDLMEAAEQQPASTTLMEAVVHLRVQAETLEAHGLGNQHAADIRTVLGALAAAEDRIVAALTAMDNSMYGDPEVPFAMRAALTGTKVTEPTVSTTDYQKGLS